LKAGDRWEPALLKFINDSDVMLLFWSQAAEQSQAVANEWQYALATKGDDFIVPVVIQGPPVAPPPPELRHLHFSDRIVYFTRPGSGLS
ncbi:MAG: toll/interleukin-1 receptor domain-containing protein, partial [Armatimonadota bacterium]